MVTGPENLYRDETTSQRVGMPWPRGPGLAAVRVAVVGHLRSLDRALEASAWKRWTAGPSGPTISKNATGSASQLPGSGQQGRTATRPLRPQLAPSD